MPVGKTNVRRWRAAVALALASSCWSCLAYGQGSPKNSASKPETASTASLPAQFTLLETHARFESNGDSRKEVHAIVKINSEIGARQFARLSFNFNRAFEEIEIPLVRITHASGGTADILPSAISEEPGPAAANFAAYQDDRSKSVRILGLAPKDTLEYRVITSGSHRPLAPDFWLEHSFDRTGVVSHERFVLDLPASSTLQTRFNPASPPESTEKSGSGNSARVVYTWQETNSTLPSLEEGNSDLSVTTFPSWENLSARLASGFLPRAMPEDDVNSKALELSRGAKSGREKLEALYFFVAQKIRTADLPFSAGTFVARPLRKILESGYASAEEKALLLSALCAGASIQARQVLVSERHAARDLLPSPDAFSRVLVSADVSSQTYWLNPALEVAPFGAVQGNLRGNPGLLLTAVPETLRDASGLWPVVARDLPFPSMQRVSVEATLGENRSLSAKVKYVMRGDNELLLRVAFHQTPKENWKNVAQLLALSDGFRGQITNVTPSDPCATNDPFTVEYEIVQPKFVDWSKKPVRIPALLPLLGLPDPPAKSGASAPPVPIELGTPLDVNVSVELHLPAGTTARVPVGTSLERDFATYSSHYSAKSDTIAASRHINFIAREIPAARAAEYNQFYRTVQNDESQVFQLERSEPASAQPSKP